jgi:hypothetical protein
MTHGTSAFDGTMGNSDSLSGATSGGGMNR